MPAKAYEIDDDREIVPGLAILISRRLIFEINLTQKKKSRFRPQFWTESILLQQINEIWVLTIVNVIDIVEI